jgi:hypothetical protein
VAERRSRAGAPAAGGPGADQLDEVLLAVEHARAAGAFRARIVVEGYADSRICLKRSACSSLSAVIQGSWADQL